MKHLRAQALVIIYVSGWARCGLRKLSGRAGAFTSRMRRFGGPIGVNQFGVASGVPNGVAQFGPPRGCVACAAWV